jgi:cell division protein FtsI (penicillin-binding protein 3)
VVDPASGNVLSEAVPTPVRRAVSEATARQVSEWLEGVVADGTGKKARLPGWRVAGKTGTAQKADPVTHGYSADKRFSSFVGFVPADAPRFAMPAAPLPVRHRGDVLYDVTRQLLALA